MIVLTHAAWFLWGLVIGAWAGDVAGATVRKEIMEMGETSACFDCGATGTADKPLWSTTVASKPRDTQRGKVLPPAGSIALCSACREKEDKRAS